MTSAQIANNVYMKVVAASEAVTECSQALDATGASQATVTGIVIQIASGGTLSIKPEGSNDQSSWFDLGSTNTADSVMPFQENQAVGGFAYIRVRWEFVSATVNDDIVFSATLNLGL